METLIGLRKFVTPEIVFGSGARKLGIEYLMKFASRKPFIVTDSGIIESGWATELYNELESAELDYTVFSNVSENPRSEQVMEGSELYKETKSDVILSIGGGSPMDLAKAIGVVVTNGGHILDYKGIDKIINPIPPIILIPTTAGSSADVSQFSIITNRKELVKTAIISKSLVAEVALIDPKTTLTMSNYLTACTGVDALVHAIEAFVSKASSDLTDLHAIEAIKILIEYLPKALEKPDDLIIRQKIMFGSMEAGLAFSNAILGAVHAMAHSLGGFLDLPHGECNALLLDHVVDFNFNYSVDKFKIISQLMGINIKAKSEKEIKLQLLKKIRKLKNSLGITSSLSKKGVSKSDIPILSKKALQDACILTNPRKPDQRDIEAIYENAL